MPMLTFPAALGLEIYILVLSLNLYPNFAYESIEGSCESVHLHRLLEPSLLNNAIIRDYLIAFWLSPEVSTRDPIISPRTLA